MLQELKKGRIHRILDIEKRKWNDKTFRSQQVWVEIEKFNEYGEKSQYSGWANFEAKFDRVFEALKGFNEGEYVNITYALEGNLSKKPDKPEALFNKLTLVKIEHYAAGSAPTSSFSAPAAPASPSVPLTPAAPAPQAKQVDEFAGEEDDLPFD